MSAGTPPLSGPPSKPQVKALNCPQCGAAITLRSFQQAVTVVCENCHSILDAKDPTLQVLQQFQAIIGELPPLIPLGTRGKLRGTDYEVIGFQRRSIESDGVRYDWHEYLLFNPYKGFRYLSEYQGHWNDVTVCKDLPVVQSSFVRTANYLGEVYRHFQTADATTGYVIGEFPWQVRVGERASVTDYIRPPRVLSCEQSAGETTWSLGEYTYGLDIWKAFNLPGRPPEPIGVFENQPAPTTIRLKQVWTAFIVLAIFLVGLMAFTDMVASKDPVFSASYQLPPGAPKGEVSFVTDVFELKGRTSNVELKTAANVSNSWIYLNYALINQDTGRAWDFGREVSFYSGYDSDGSWSEGSRRDTVIVPSVPPGHYYLRIEPEADARHPSISYSITLRRDVPVFSFYGLALLGLFVPVLIATLKSLGFERARWSESDHPILQKEND
jgi:Domain of unknown function (DUF4178)